MTDGSCVAKNEGLFREVNDRILELEDGFGPREPATMLAAFVCECATMGCTTRVQMRVEEYRFARERPDRFQGTATVTVVHDQMPGHSAVNSGQNYIST